MLHVDFMTSHMTQTGKSAMNKRCTYSWRMPAIFLSHFTQWNKQLQKAISTSREFSVKPPQTLKPV